MTKREDHSEPTYENQLWHARKLLDEKGLEAVHNPHAMIGQTCRCGTCFCCAAWDVYEETRKKHVEPLYSIVDIKRQHDKAGSYWFSKDTMRFFGTRVSDMAVFPCKKEKVTYFVTSEQPPNSPRKYSVRRAKWESADIDTVGEFCGYDDRRSAARAAEKLANLGEHGE